MRAVLCASLLCSLPLFAQTQAASAGKSPAQAAPVSSAAHVPAQPAQIEDSEVGFSYRLPSDWEFVAPPPAPEVTVPFPGVAATKKGDACVEVVLTAKHGAPASAVVVTALPFACYGQTMKESNLANFGDGAAEGLKQTFDVTGPVEGRYTLGSHRFWIERAKGTPKGRAGNPHILETACTILAKGAVCWTTMAADWHSLLAFERAPVTLDGESFAELVPGNAFLPEP
jgi:hypothetical protein